MEHLLFLHKCLTDANVIPSSLIGMNAPVINSMALTEIYRLPVASEKETTYVDYAKLRYSAQRGRCIAIFGEQWPALATLQVRLLHNSLSPRVGPTHRHRDASTHAP